MKIKKITDEKIIFNNGNEISYFHEKDCCEDNYADFEQIEELALSYDFDEDLIFEKLNKQGFRFGDKRAMFFIPCYSIQNGYYSSDINILYNDNIVLHFDCEPDFI